MLQNESHRVTEIRQALFTRLALAVGPGTSAQYAMYYASSLSIIAVNSFCMAQFHRAPQMCPCDEDAVRPLGRITRGRLLLKRWYLELSKVLPIRNGKRAVFAEQAANPNRLS